MGQMCSTEQTGPIRRPPDGINRFVLEEKQLIFGRRIIPLPRHDFLLQSEGICELHSPKPARAEGIHSCRRVPTLMIDKRLFKATMSSSYQFDFYRCLSPENTY